MPWLFSCVVFFEDKMPLLLLIKDHKPTLWSLTAPQQLLNLICSISIVFCKLYSLLWIVQAIRTLPGDWGKWLNLGLSDALTGSCACASSRQPNRTRYLHLRSERSNKESAFTSRKDRSRGWEGAGGVQTWSCWVGQECLAGARFYFGVGPLREQSRSVWHYGGHPNG